MGRDDSILILKFKDDLKNKQSIYIIIWTQSVENFTKHEFINIFLSKNNNSLWNFCRNHQNALRIAQKMYMERRKPQHGILLIDTKLYLHEFGGNIIHSPLVGSPKNLKLIEFKFQERKYVLNSDVNHKDYYQELPKPDESGYEPLGIKRLEEFFLFTK